MGIEITQNLPEDIWRSFVKQHLDSSIFQTPEMFNVFKNARGHEPFLWAVVNSNQEPLAIFLPVNTSLNNGPFQYFTTLSICFGSVLSIPRAEGNEALNLHLKTYKHHTTKGSLFTELRNLSDLSSIQPVFEDQGFDFEPHLNYLVNLRQPVNELKRNMDSEVMTKEEFPFLYSVVQNVFKRIQVPLAHISLFASAFHILYPLQMIKVLAASADGTIIGAAIRLLYKDNIFDWYAGALRSHATFKAHDLLNW